MALLESHLVGTLRDVDIGPEKLRGAHPSFLSVNNGELS